MRYSLCLIVLLAFNPNAFSKEADQALEVTFRQLLADNMNYEDSRTAFLKSEGVEAFLEMKLQQPSDWREAILADACLAWLRSAKEIEALIDSEELWGVYMRWCDELDPTGGDRIVGAAKANRTTRRLLYKRPDFRIIGDRTLVAYLGERLIVDYHSSQWAAVVEKKIKTHRAEVIKAELEVWRLIALSVLGEVATQSQLRPLAYTVLRGVETERLVAARALSNLKDRPARERPPDLDWKRSTTESGRWELQANEFHEWHAHDVVFSKAEQQVIWQTLLVALAVDPSTVVRKAAAKALGANGNPDCLPYLEQELAVLEDEDVRKAVQDAVDRLKKIPVQEQVPVQ